MTGDASLGGNVTTSGDLTLSDGDGVVLTADTELDGDNVTVSSGVSGAFTLTLDGASSVDVQGAVTTTNLTTETAATIDSANIAGDLSVSGGTLTVDTANAVVGGNADINSQVSVTSGSLAVTGTSAIGANVTTSTSQTYTGAATLDAGGALNLTGTTVSFGNSLTGDNENLTITLSLIHI